MRSLVRLAARIAAAGLLVAVLTGGCRGATEVTIDLRTLTPDLRCSDLKRVSIVVAGDPDTAESHLGLGFLSADVTGTCEADDRVGTLVVTPGGSAGAVIVAAAVGPDAHCTPDGKYAGCVVARRVFTFVEHAGLHLPITLERSCLDVPCTAQTSCRDHACVDSTTDCSSGECSSPAEPVVGPNGNEVPPDAPSDAFVETGSDGPVDGPASDASDASDVVDAPASDANPANEGNACPTSPTPTDCYTMTMQCCYAGMYACGASCGPYFAFGCLGRKHCFGAFCCGMPNPMPNQIDSQCDPSGGGEYCSQNGSHYLCTTDADCPTTLPYCSGTYFSQSQGIVHQCAATP
jgi:hypothetical protein